MRKKRGTPVKLPTIKINKKGRAIQGLCLVGWNRIGRDTSGRAIPGPPDVTSAQAAHDLGPSL